MTKIGETGPMEHNHAPWAHGMHLGHGKNMPCALDILLVPWAYQRLHFMRLGHASCALSI